VLPDLHRSGGLTEALRIYYIAGAAGIKTCPHGVAGSAYGQHFLYALPGCPYGEYSVTMPAGVPLEEMARSPAWPWRGWHCRARQCARL
jgi:L-alanine-DL-glutamate epimerase-like enolase superfamily enzyme